MAPFSTPGRRVADRMLARLRSQAGFTIVEVLASALVVITAAMGAFAAIDGATKTADANKGKATASNIAQADQERLRGMKLTDLADRDETTTQSVDGKTYTVRSQALWVTDVGATSTCASNEDNPRYLRIVSTITWPKMRTNPVVATSLRAIPNGTLPGRGVLAVDVGDRNAAGVAGITVSISGPKALSATTPASGCVTFGSLPVGTYTVTFGRSGWIESKLPNRSTISDQVVVGEDQIANPQYTYDQAGKASVLFKTSQSFGTAGTPPNVTYATPRYTLAHSELGPPNIDSLPSTTPPASAQSLVSGAELFPFSTPYKAWAGGCAENNPSLFTAASPATSSSTPYATPNLTVPGGAGTSTQTTLWMPRLRVQAKASNNGNLGSGRIVIKAAGGVGCTATLSANTTQSGSTTSGFSYADFILPFGTYTACAQIGTSTSTTTAKKEVTVTNGVPIPASGQSNPATATTGTQNGYSVPAFNLPAAGASQAACS